MNQALARSLKARAVRGRQVDDDRREATLVCVALMRAFGNWSTSDWADSETQ